MTNSSTVPKQLKPFVKGDPRINRKGRPKSFDTLRALAQSLSNEPATDAAGNPIIIDGHIATQAEMILRSLMKSNPERFLEIGYGKVPQPIEVSGPERGPLQVRAYDYSNAIAPLAPGSVDDSESPGEGEVDSDGAPLGQDADGG